jgi:hypothetical protein
MAGIQRMFENKKGVPVDMKKVLIENDWIKAYVMTEGGAFAFSDLNTAKVFVGEGDKAVGTITVV